MKFSLIICTYQRPGSLLNLLRSVREQSRYPDEILVIDGSEGSETEDMLAQERFANLKYFRVSEKQRGLTRQRNFGVDHAEREMEVLSFLDDDIVLTPHYFENLISSFSEFQDAIGIGGYILEEAEWEKSKENPKFDEFEFDGFKRKLGSRNLLRKRVGLLSDKPPGVMPEFSNGLAVSFLPPSGKTYPVEFFMGGAAAYRKELFEKISFSSYFEGYGLYEDMDFCLRASKYGQLYVNTSAGLYHYHDTSGRPDYYKYGKMVIRNGWYVWRLKYPSPSLRARFKWNATAFLLTLVRLLNIITTSKKRESLNDAAGRITGWLGLMFNKPKH